jgi:mRNA interferase RelE/StbE
MRHGAGSACPGEAADRIRRTSDQPGGAFLDDPGGIREVLDPIDRLADDPRPPGSFPYRSPDLRRLRAGRHRGLYEITEDAVTIRHIARGTAGS